MEMYIAPIVGSGDKFLGSVYVMGHEDDDRCVFGRHGNDYETFYRLIRFDQCGSAANHTDVSMSLKTGFPILLFRFLLSFTHVLVSIIGNLSVINFMHNVLCLYSRNETSSYYCI